MRTEDLNQQDRKDHDGGDEHAGINRRLISDRLERDRMVHEDLIVETCGASTLRHTPSTPATRNGKRDLSANDDDKIKGDLPGQQVFRDRVKLIRWPSISGLRCDASETRIGSRAERATQQLQNDRQRIGVGSKREMTRSLTFGNGFEHTQDPSSKILADTEVPGRSAQPCWDR